MAKTKITVNDNYVTVEADDDSLAGRTTTTYFVRGDGKLGYVRIDDAAGRYPQVCNGLASRGETLMATAETLPAVIRREIRELRRAQRAEQKRFA